LASQSELFGIAQIEPLGTGAVCVVSNICGCVGFLDSTWRRLGSQQGLASMRNLVVADYVSLPADQLPRSAWDALRIDKRIRNRIESTQSRVVAQEIAQRLPQDDGAKGSVSWTMVSVSQSKWGGSLW
jgi:hypothetical protein